MIQDFQNGHVVSETHNGITTIEFFHPQSNSLPRRLLEDLANEIHAAGSDNDTSVIVLRSGGEKAFCAGASFAELSTIENDRKGFEFFRGFADVINALRVIPKLTIGRIHGKCIGGGVGLAAAVDYAIACDAAEVRLSELSLGIGPFVVGPAIERKIGLSAYSQLAIDATMWRSADWARRKGLYAELHNTIEDMNESVSRLAHQLVRTSPKAMAELKKVLWKGTEHWDKLLYERAEISGRLVIQEASKTAIEKIREKV